MLLYRTSEIKEIPRQGKKIHFPKEKGWQAGAVVIQSRAFRSCREK